MKLVLELDDELARKLEERARSEGKRPEALVLEALERQFGRSKKEVLERFKKLPTFDLGGREITREFIYEDWP